MNNAATILIMFPMDRSSLALYALDDVKHRLLQSIPLKRIVLLVYGKERKGCNKKVYLQYLANDFNANILLHDIVCELEQITLQQHLHYTYCIINICSVFVYSYGYSSILNLNSY